MSATGAASPTEVEHPVGSVPGICSAAVGLLATLVAFIAYADFRLESGARWRWTQVSPIVLAFAAMICMALVPLLATRPQARHTPIDRSAMQRARVAFAFGAGCMILAVAWFVGRELIAHQA